ncbi:uncharacterized protein ACIB01_013907 [Guaruba guarouba]
MCCGWEPESHMCSRLLLTCLNGSVFLRSLQKCCTFMTACCTRGWWNLQLSTLDHRHSLITTSDAQMVPWSRSWALKPGGDQLSVSQLGS